MLARTARTDVKNGQAAAALALRPIATEYPAMSKLLVRGFGISLDGYGAGPAQDLQHPLGIHGPDIMEWFFHTRVFQRMHGQAAQPADANPVDEQFAQQGFSNIGAWILGRNMFGPIRGPWPNDAWRGWWGEEPPYHTPVFVLTHHARATCVSAAASPPCVNICARDSSMSCIWPCARSCSGAASRCLPIWTCAPSATTAWRASPGSGPRTCGCAGMAQPSARVARRT